MKSILIFPLPKKMLGIDPGEDIYYFLTVNYHRSENYLPLLLLLPGLNCNLSDTQQANYTRQSKSVQGSQSPDQDQAFLPFFPSRMSTVPISLPFSLPGTKNN
jgi:hypothetical protein